MKRSPKADRLFSVIAQLDRHFAADDTSPADADRWRECKRHITRMLDGLGLARPELESNERPPKERVRVALRHVRFGLDHER